MPRFKLNKLVRDKLRDEYNRVGQKAIYKKLSLDEHKLELKNKIIEEVSEIKIDDQLTNIISEIADVQQSIDDLKSLYNITPEQINLVQKIKFDKKGGFAGGTFVETLELTDNDKWIDYYREHPNIFPEV